MANELEALRTENKELRETCRKLQERLSELDGVMKADNAYLTDDEMERKSGIISRIVRHQPKQFHLVLYCIFSLWKKGVRTLLTTGGVYELYSTLCHKASLHQLSQRSVSGIIGELDKLGVINAKVISTGRYGRTRSITPCLPKENIENLMGLVTDSLRLQV